MSVWSSLNQWGELWIANLGQASWQGALAFALVWLICRALPKIPAAWQCWMWRLAYFKLFLALFWPNSIPLPILPASPKPAPLFSSARFGAVSGRPLTRTHSPAPVGARSPDQPRSSALLLGRSTTNPRHNWGGGEGQPARRSRGEGGGEGAPRSITLTWSGWAFALWLAGLGIASSRVAGKWRQSVRLRRTAIDLDDEELTRTCARVAGWLGLRRLPSLKQEDSISSPCVTGVWCPLIVLPSRATLPDWELVLAHELAHLKRQDLAWAWLPTLAKLFFFFHPAIWLAEREVRLGQELACDELALRVTRRRPCEYAETLLNLAERANQLRRRETPFLIVPMIETKKSLFRRLTAMKEITPPSPLRGMFAALVVLLFGLAALPPWRLVAQTAPPAVAPATVGPDQAATERLDPHKLKAELEEARRIIGKLEAALKDQRQALEETLIARRQAAAMPADVAHLGDVLAAQMEVAKVEMEIAEAALHRKQELLKQNLVPPEQVAYARKALAQARVGLETAKAQLSQAGAQQQRAMRPDLPTIPNEQQRKRQIELLEEEIKLAEQVAADTRKRIANGRGTSDELIQAERELFQLKRERAAADSDSDKTEIKLLFEQEMKLVQRQLEEMKKRIEVGAAATGSEIALKRELLRLKRAMAGLE